MDTSIREQGSGTQQYPKGFLVSLPALDGLIKWLASLIKLTKEEQEALKFGDFSIIDKKLSESKLIARLKTPVATTTVPPPVPKRHQSGGTPPKGEQKAPASWKDADELAWNMMKEK